MIIIIIILLIIGEIFDFTTKRNCEGTKTIIIVCIILIVLC